MTLAACDDQSPLEPRRLSPVPKSDGLIPIQNPTDLVGITAGMHHSCARQRGGNVYCWGWNINGQIGTGESDPFGQPGGRLCQGDPCVIAPTFAVNATQVSAGGSSTCALNSATKP